MRVRRIILSEDYDHIKTWWERRGGVPPPLVMLPDIGVMVEDEGVPTACAFLYTISNCSMAIVEWEATNPDVHSVKRRIQGLHMAFDFFEEWARNQETQFILSWVIPGRGDGRLLEGRGWIKPQGEPHEMLAFVTQPKEVACP